MEKLGPDDPLGVPPAGGWGRIGAYRLLARLGAGGMGQVFLARSDRGRTVAVKLVRQELAEQEEFRARFRQEVQAARRVGGYWTAPVLDADTEAAIPWVATGYVAGPSLETVVGHDHGALPERSVRILAAGLAHALKDIHAAELIHRDLKPSNVLVTIDGPRVIDFGIARALETVTDGGLTRTGALVGSPGFMAPEQVRGDRITPACDVFCLGSVLSYAATGDLPFGTANSGVHALMFRIAQEEPDLAGVPEGIADLVRQCLRKDPASRPTLDDILERTGAEDTVTDGRSRDPWLPGTLVAQLGRHAVQLLDTEDPEVSSGAPPQTPSGAGPRTPAPQTPEGLKKPQAQPARPAFEEEAVQADSGGPGAAAPRDGKGKGGGGEETPGPPEASPEHEHAPTPDGPTPPPPGTPGAAPFDHLPTMTTGLPGTPPPTTPPGGPPGGPPVHPAYGYPQQHPQPAAYGYPHYQHQPAGYPPPPGSTPPYGPPYGPTPPYGPGVLPQPGPPPERGGRSTAVLIIVALIVALGAGASVYALMKGDGDNRAGGGDSTTSPTATAPAPGPATEGPTQPPTTPEETPTDGAIPVKYLGTWTASIDNATGHNTRELTIQQGEVGDTVLSLTADGPAGSGTYHCVFRAELSEAPSAGGPLRIGASEVTAGRPATSCSPGEATELTVLPDGRLRRVNTSNGDELTYTKQG
ncbi:serine/threonine protein kinase [Streptomyces umbrinus]|uniref:Serine/threonine protein kinase n=1 Tax=Streptomyces umbrinus TaxID=67370 RepID=A0ABU0SZP9_9ACTN|nr:serine/threonine-protein kinase [Streptomyces umbrinus]MDQ1028211.1 serine/threonine protein kinase [Streptomyces umbrinus]